MPPTPLTPYRADGHSVQQAVSEQAYTQSFFGGTPTWVRLPKDQWLQKWLSAGYKDPVDPLLRALYGHPTAGDCWSNKLTGILRQFGFSLNEAYPGVHFRIIEVAGKRVPIVIVAYVDDLLLSGPQELHENIWKRLQQQVKLDAPEKLDRFLGRAHTMIEA